LIKVSFLIIKASAGARGVDLRLAGQAGEHDISDVANCSIVDNNRKQFVRSEKTKKVTKVITRLIIYEENL